MKSFLVSLIIFLSVGHVNAAGEGTKTDFLWTAALAYESRDAGCEKGFDIKTDNVRKIACRLGETLKLSGIKRKAFNKIIEETLKDMEDSELVCK